MAARNTTITCNGTTLLSDGAVSALRLQNLTGYNVPIQATSTSTAPTSTAGALNLEPGQIWAADLTVAQAFPGVGSSCYIWAMPDNSANISVSHA